MPCTVQAMLMEFMITRTINGNQSIEQEYHFKIENPGIIDDYGSRDAFHNIINSFEQPNCRNKIYYSSSYSL